MLHWSVIPLAVLLDVCLGDPEWLPHPVRWMGRAIEQLEGPFRRLPFHLIVNGGLFWLALVGAVFIAGYTVIAIADAIDIRFGILVQILLIYYALSARCLAKEALGVWRALNAHDLETARKRVSMIVGRDTRQLDEKGVAQAAVETVAENLVDGFVAPLFFAAMGGAPLALVYKMVNTLDSMVGYKNDRYKKFGKAAARMDDLFNYLPARLAVPIIAVAAEWMTKGSGKRALLFAWRDGRKHTSPNAGFSEAAFSGALQVRLGGPSIYNGREVVKPYIGEGFGPVEPGHVPQACRLMLAAAILWSTCMWPISIWLN